MPPHCLASALVFAGVRAMSFSASVSVSLRARVRAPLFSPWLCRRCRCFRRGCVCAWLRRRSFWCLGGGPPPHGRLVRAAKCFFWACLKGLSSLLRCSCGGFGACQVSHKNQRDWACRVAVLVCGLSAVHVMISGRAARRAPRLENGTGNTSTSKRAVNTLKRRT